MRWVLVLTVCLFGCKSTEPPPEPPAPFRGKILFMSTRDGGPQIYSMNTDGSEVTRFPISTPGVAGAPAVSPDGEWLAYSQGGDIWVVRPDGSDPRNVTASPASEGSFAWSPDGTKLAYTRDGDIYLSSVDGTNIRRVTTDPASDASPSWSPDGRIVFQSERDGNLEIYVVGADGSGLQRLTDDPQSDTGPVWSPDGSRVAFRRLLIQNPGGSIGQIVLIDPAGTILDTIGTPVSAGSLDWSRNSIMLAFTGEGDIWTVRTDGSGLVNLTAGSGAFNFDPSWSP